MSFDRRTFLTTAAGLACAGLTHGEPNEWGSPVMDIHYHPGGDPGQEIRHADGSGVTRAVLLPGTGAEERAKTDQNCHRQESGRDTCARGYR